MHILCGDISPRSKPGGIQGTWIRTQPQQYVKDGSALIRWPCYKYDFVVYKNPQVWSERGPYSTCVVKNGVSSIWPTALSYEGIVWTITYLAQICRYYSCWIL